MYKLLWKIVHITANDKELWSQSIYSIKSWRVVLESERDLSLYIKINRDFNRNLLKTYNFG